MNAFAGQQSFRLPSRDVFWSCMLLVAVVATAPVRAQEHPLLNQPETMRQQADQAFDKADWEFAVEIYEQQLKENPNDIRALVRIGQALSALGKYDEAIEWHQKAADHPRARGTGLYNWGCTLCAQGKSDEALTKLEEALDAGFTRQGRFREDNSLASLREDERFIALADRYERMVADSQRNSRAGFGIMTSDPPPSESDKRREAAVLRLEFRIGTWGVSTRDGTQLGTSVVSWRDGTTVSEESWTPAGSETPEVISSYNPESRTWTQRWTEKIGETVQLDTVIKHTNSMDMTGQATLENGETVTCQLVLSIVGEDSIGHRLRISRDGGNTWEELMERVYRRVE